MLIWHVFSFYPKAISGWWPDRKAGSVECWLKTRASCRGSTSGKCIWAEFSINQYGSQWGKENFVYRAPVSAAWHPKSAQTFSYSWFGQYNSWGWTLLLTHAIKTCVWSDGVKGCAACLPASSVLQGLYIKEVRGCTDTEFCDVVAMLLGVKASRGCQTGTRNKAWGFLRVFVSPPLLLQYTGHKML